MENYIDVGRAIREFLEGLVLQTAPSSPAEAMALRNGVLVETEAVFSTLFDRLSQADAPCGIAASEVVVELVDRATGRLFRRPLELSYEENENGIVLCGEDMSGQPSSIVYLSDSYLQRLTDISGQGPEEDHCH
ncbi:MAG: hypothetical protein VB051_12180 [Candidatus Pelethousia sp.]|nr:hypothetical protein [Candidatus Pelethousia sp.]